MSTEPISVETDEWKPQLLRVRFLAGGFELDTAACGPLFFAWPDNEFDPAPPPEGRMCLCFFDPIAAEELLVFAADEAGGEMPFLGIAEYVAPDETDEWHEDDTISLTDEGRAAVREYKEGVAQ